jgi:type I restriction enzyme R subunit
MSVLLDEIIAARKAKAIEYEEYLKRVADLARRVEGGLADDIAEPLKRSPALRAIYNQSEAHWNIDPAPLRLPKKRRRYSASSDPKLELCDST